MAKTFYQLFTHIVFSTKHRQPFIDESIEDELFRYIAANCQAVNCYPVQIGGYLDHIHVLTNLHKGISIQNFLEEIKSNSSKWIKTKGEQYKNFYWQRGYGAFSVDIKGVDKVKNYIINQKEHHQNKDMDFKKEFRSILKRHKIEWDERYIWD